MAELDTVRTLLVTSAVDIIFYPVYTQIDESSRSTFSQMKSDFFSSQKWQNINISS